MAWWIAGVLIALALLGTKVLVESRRERRRERRYALWARISDGLPEGGRLTGVEPDGRTLVEHPRESREHR
ncbi:hypothetical protein ACFWY9_39815 [Amycolatopsis sp. NPDC059027]|uniref:hypothetical protein n=1 Tax=unclassified Amycolatopsis TaxID=2618356 RepID=UPI003670A876